MIIDSWIEHFKQGAEVFFKKDVPLIACKRYRNQANAINIFDKYEKLLHSYSKNKIIQVFKGISKFNIKDKLNKIKCPTLIIHGKRDKLIPLQFAQETHNLIQNSRLEILNGCHFVLVHNYEEFNEIIITYLK